MGSSWISTCGFVGMCGWGFILFEIFMGEAGSVCASGDKVNKHVQEAYTEILSDFKERPLVMTW